MREVRTNAVGQFVADLRGEVGAAGSDDVDADLGRLADLVTDVFGVETDDLVATVLTSAYPLLRHPVAAGARPDVIPIAVEPLLRHEDARSAARHTLGPRVTRPLVRALARSLLPRDDGRIAWEPLLLALMAADRCGPEQLAAILTARPHRCGAASFSRTDIDRARAMFEDIQPRRIAEQLVDALERDGGTTELARRLIRFDARPPAPPPRPEAPAPRPRPARPAGPPMPPDPGDATIDYPASWTTVVGETVEGASCTVVLPETGNELLEWGAIMGNCLGAYRTVAALGRTRLMGFTEAGALRYVAEISPSRTLRQLEAPGNSLPLPSRERAIVRFLRDRRLIEADARRDL